MGETNFELDVEVCNVSIIQSIVFYSCVSCLFLPMNVWPDATQTRDTFCISVQSHIFKFCYIQYNNTYNNKHTIINKKDTSSTEITNI